jgi:phosphatidylglycerol---prolipoprotein diacylglyceryl transferase
MRQVLFHIPIRLFGGDPDGIAVYGFGMMLVLAYVCCTWLAGRLGKREGVAPEQLQDLAIWLLISGILGARITYILQYRHQFTSFWQFFRIWDGGLVFYGSAIGGVIGYFLARHFVLRKYNLSSWKMADLIAPCVALGLCLGRVGCFLNGCCYGHVACADCPAAYFPLSSPPRFVLVANGYQTAAGFTMSDVPGVDSRTVGRVEPGSAAERAGMKPFDVIVVAHGEGNEEDRKIESYDDLIDYMVINWRRGKNDIQFSVQRRENGRTETVRLPVMVPRTIGLHPTQLYESVSMALCLFLLLSFYPFRRRDGEVMVLFMLCYGVHRFVNEMLRNDTGKVAFDLTLSQNGSVIVIVAALLLGLYLWRKPVQYPSAPQEKPPSPAESEPIPAG